MHRYRALCEHIAKTADMKKSIHRGGRGREEGWREVCEIKYIERARETKFIPSRAGTREEEKEEDESEYSGSLGT